MNEYTRRLIEKIEEIIPGHWYYPINYDASGNPDYDYGKGFFDWEGYIAHITHETDKFWLKYGVVDRVKLGGIEAYLIKDFGGIPLVNGQMIAIERLIDGSPLIYLKEEEK